MINTTYYQPDYSGRKPRKSDQVKATKMVHIYIIGSGLMRLWIYDPDFKGVVSYLMPTVSEN